jgi:tripartite ATP-independent transporter DctM subunit
VTASLFLASATVDPAWINTLLVILMFATFVVLLFTGYPVAFLLGGVGVLFTGICVLSDACFDTDTGMDFRTLGLIVNRTFKLMENGILVALPMFIFMGLMLDRSGIAERLMNATQSIVGRVHGGLALTVTAIGVLLAASTGIIGASVVLLGLLSIRPMLNQGYAKELAVGVVCSSGTLGILIPPSIMLVVMADQLADQAVSVGDLFMGAVFPGLILAGLYAGYIIIYGLIRPEAAPVSPASEPFSIRLVGRLLWAVVPPALLIVVVLGSIFMGIATPTEASGMGALGAMLLAAANRKLSVKVVRTVSQESLRTTAFILAILIGASCFALVLRSLGGDELVERSLSSLPFSPYVVLLIILGIVFLLGFVLDWIEITMIILPLVAPVVSGLAFNLNDYDGALTNPAVIWFAILVAVTLQTSFLTPPVGFALFYVKGVCPPEIKISHLYRGVVPFIILQLIGLAILIIWPQIVTWLPAAAYGK